MSDSMMQLVGGGLVAAVVFLFGLMMRTAEANKKERDECLRDRLNLWQEIYRLSQHNCPSADCPMRASPTPLNDVTRTAGKRIEELQSRLKVNPA